MKAMLLGLILMGAGLQVAHADSGGLMELLAQKAKESKAGTSVGLNDGVVGAVAYLPVKTIFTKDGDKVTDWVELNVGGETRQGSKPQAILFPALNVVAISQQLTVKPQWAQNHVRSSLFPPIFVGLGPVRTLDWQQLKSFQWKQLKDDLRLIVSVRFDLQIKE